MLLFTNRRAASSARDCLSNFTVHERLTNKRKRPTISVRPVCATRTCVLLTFRTFLTRGCPAHVSKRSDRDTETRLIARRVNRTDIFDNGGRSEGAHVRANNGGKRDNRNKSRSAGTAVSVVRAWERFKNVPAERRDCGGESMGRFENVTSGRR